MTPARAVELIGGCLCRDRQAWKTIRRRAASLLSMPVVKHWLVAHFVGFSEKRLRVAGGDIRFVAGRDDYVAGRPGGVDRLGRFEAPLMEAFLESLRPESIVFDVGGGIGLYALVASQRTSAPVYVFEPNPVCALYLRRNLNGRRYRLIRKCVGAVDDDQTVTLDRFCDEHRLAPTHVKMDIEGHEIQALKGMRQVLRTHRPMLFVEFHRRLILQRLGLGEEAVQQFFATLQELGYTLGYNGHHYAMHTSPERSYNFEWSDRAPNLVNVAVIARPERAGKEQRSAT